MLAPLAVGSQGVNDPQLGADTDICSRNDTRGGYRVVVCVYSGDEPPVRRVEDNEERAAAASWLAADAECHVTHLG